MFQGELQKRLDLLDGNLVLASDSQMHLKEKNEKGKADLTLNLQNPVSYLTDWKITSLGIFRIKNVRTTSFLNKKVTAGCYIFLN